MCLSSSPSCPIDVVHLMTDCFTHSGLQRVCTEVDPDAAESVECNALDLYSNSSAYPCSLQPTANSA